MRLFFLLLTFLVFLAEASRVLGQSQAPRTTLFVSSAGNDAWTGMTADPANDGSDGPFRTLARARDAVRAIPQSTRGLVDVVIRGGVYRLTETLRLGPEDGGEDSATTVTWRSFEEEMGILSGSRVVSGFGPVRDPVAVERIAAAYRDSVLAINLNDQGISDFGDFSDENGPGLELFFDGVRMTRARYPNEGYIRIAEVPQSGDSLYHVGSFQWTRNGIPVGRHYGVFRVDDERVRSWSKSDDIWMHGYYVWDWRDGFQKVARIDGEEGLVYPEPPHHSYGYSEGQPLYFFNVLEELDRPGEWVIDTRKGTLYFWPPGPIDESTVTVSVMPKSMIAIDGASNLTIERLTFEETRSTPIEVSGGTHVTLAGNTIRNIGTTGIVVDGGTGHVVLSNDLHDLGGGGIQIHGGERLGLVPGNHEVLNNHVYRFSQIRKTSVPGIRVTGVGNRIAHNELHDSPDAGIFYFGNDMILEYNEVHHIAQESDDVGAFYIGRDYSMQGNVVRYNYIHDIAKPMHVGVMAVYLDDFTSGVTVHGNIFFRAGRCAFMGGGRSNVITNNIFVECSPAIFLDARGKVRNVEFFDGRITVLEDRLAAVRATEPPYSERYPELVHLYEDDPAMPKYNVVRSNIALGGTFLGLYSGLPISIVDLADNTIDTDVLLQTSDETGVETGNFHIATVEDSSTVDLLRDLGNRVLDLPREAFDPSTGRLELPRESEVWPEHFRPIPTDSIGLMVDEYRKVR